MIMPTFILWMQVVAWFLLFGWAVVEYTKKIPVSHVWHIACVFLLFLQATTDLFTKSLQ